MADIIRLHANPHEQTEQLLPWYVTGQIDPADRVKVEAHLADCPRCQTELQFERRLSAAVKDLPLDTALGWADLRPRLDVPPPPAAWRGEPMRRAIRSAVAWPGRAGWMLAAQAAAVVAAVVLIAPTDQPAPYHTLGAAPAAAAGNVIVIFRPDATERDLRSTLIATGARLADGPTAAGAYVLRVPQAERDTALAKLRRRADVVLAQPIDAQDPP